MLTNFHESITTNACAEVLSLSYPAFNISVLGGEVQKATLDESLIAKLSTAALHCNYIFTVSTVVNSNKTTNHPNSQ